ncbi:hypothetical protein CLOHYLEM_05692 [[Clostridium] hylemonae DSM 15053]|uniref:Uncharacterized protein n=1 Tax=[Clostridium] hylemonae DSM 15053 TaxID=553973 RepID=C0C0T7_9FIRM|nr:hypothetical protein CLOHYLEM_05692 [[Clostridium] hylemonae DSM 15053]
MIRACRSFFISNPLSCAVSICLFYNNAFCLTTRIDTILFINEQI